FGGEGGERIGGGMEAGLERNQVPTSWASEGEVIKIDITATDVHGIQSVLTLLPWSYEIPHVDVVFDSSQDAVRPDEVPKLEEAWGHIEETLKKYGEIVDMELFVAGYTDTQGDAGSNRGLSQRRARAIAAWFRNRGFKRPIWIQGFGEDALAVPTADGVAEEKNRRALYILSARKPSITGDIPRSNWQNL
ncbi:MAG: OmpA family protein, partial [Myxococcota bacterium]